MPLPAILHILRLAVLLCLLAACPAQADLTSIVQTAQAIHRIMPTTPPGASPAAPASPAQVHEAPPAFDPTPLELDGQHFNFQRDWWKYSIMLVVFATCSFLLLKVAKQILSFLIIMACLAVSIGLAYLTGPTLEPLLRQCAPSLDSPRCPALYWAYGIIFLMVYAIATIMVRLLKKPAESSGQNKAK